MQLSPSISRVQVDIMWLLPFFSTGNLTSMRFRVVTTTLGWDSHSKAYLWHIKLSIISRWDNVIIYIQSQKYHLLRLAAASKAPGLLCRCQNYLATHHHLSLPKAAYIGTSLAYIGASLYSSSSLLYSSSFLSSSTSSEYLLSRNAASRVDAFRRISSFLFSVSFKKIYNA